MGSGWYLPPARKNRPDRDALAWRFERYRQESDG